MGEILIYWIENKLGLDLPFFEEPKKFRKAVSNGHLIGQILRKFNIISDDQCVSLKKTLVNQSCVKNMQHLHIWLRDSGLDVDFHDLLSIVQEEPGAAMRFIYRLYLWLEAPRSKSTAGFKVLSSFKPKLSGVNMTDKDYENGCKKSSPMPSLPVIEFKPWDSLAERKRSLAIGDVQYATEPKDNIYYDAPLQHPVLLKMRPQSALEREKPGEMNQHLQVKRSEDQKYEPHDDWKHWPAHILCKPKVKALSEKEQIRTELELSRKKELEDSMAEMARLNSEALQNPTNVTTVGWKVYKDGRGNICDYRKRMKLLRKKKAEEEQLEAQRRNQRQSLAAKFLTNIPCQAYAELEGDILKRVLNIPGREKMLAEFVTTTHSFKQAFLDHMVYEQGQLTQFKDYDLKKQWDIRQQEDILRHCLQREKEKLDKEIEEEQLRAQQEATYLSNKNSVEGILKNLLDLVIKVTTYREAVGDNPPEPLMDEWAETFHILDNAEANKDEEIPEDSDILETLRMNDYIFHTGEWNIQLLPDDTPELEPPVENTGLKRLVSYVLETLFPPPEPEDELPSPQFSFAVALCGVNFNWKGREVHGLLTDLVEPSSRLHVLDASTVVQEAIKAYSNALVLSLEAQTKQNQLASSSYPDEYEGEFQTIWSQNQTNSAPLLRQSPGQHLVKHHEDEETEEESGMIVTFKEKHKKGGKHLKKKTSSLENPGKTHKTRSSASQRSNESSSKGKGKKKRSKNPSKNKYTEDETDEGNVSTDHDIPKVGSPFSFDDNLSDEDGRKVTKRALDSTLRKNNWEEQVKRLKDGEEEGEYAEHLSNTLQIYHDVNPTDPTFGLEDDIHVPLSPGDQPETWPEFVRLGKLALEDMLKGKPLDDEMTARILVERMRHYSSDGMIVVLNYPQALCQALTLENAVRKNGLQRPPCYHHVDRLVQKYRNLRSAEAGPLINLTSNTMEALLKHRSALFKYEDRIVTVDPLFKSFLDAVVVVDVNLSSRLRDPRIMNNLTHLEEKMVEAPGRSVEERLEVLLHLAFLQLKKFYSDLGICYSLELGYDEESYYPHMKKYLQSLIESRQNASHSEISSMQYSEDHPRSNVFDEEEESGLSEYEGEDSNYAGQATDTSESVPSVGSGKKKAKEKSGKEDRKSRNGKKKKGSSKDSQKSAKEDSASSKEKGKKKKKKDKDGKKEKKKKKTPTKSTEKPPEIEEVPVTDVASRISEPSVYNISPESTTFLGNFWTKMESAYLYGLKSTLGSIRIHHDRVTQYSIDFRSKLNEFMDRPDRKQDLLTQFQDKFNQVCNYIRGDYEVKAELHNRVSELRNRLSTICDEKHEQNIVEMQSILKEGYLEGEFEILINLFITLIQLEADHHCDVIQFINDFYAMTGLGKPQTIPWRDMLRINLLNRNQFLTSIESTNSVNEEESLVKPSSTNQVNLGGKETDSPRFKRTSSKKKRSKTRIKDGSSPHSTTTVEKKKSKKGNASQLEVDETEEEDPSLVENEEEEEADNLNIMSTNSLASLPPKDGPLKINTDPSKPIQDCFWEEVKEEIEMKPSYQEEIKMRHENCTRYLAEVMQTVSENILKIEEYTTNLIKTSVARRSAPLLPEGGSRSTTKTNASASTLASTDKKADSSQKEEEGKPKRKSKKTKESTSTERKKKKKKGDKSSSDREGKKKKSSEEKKKKKKKDNESSDREDGSKKKKKKSKSPKKKKEVKGESSKMMEDNANLESPTKKKKGAKRTAEWQRAVELEGRRVKVQLGLIAEKARREMKQLTDILLRVISGGEKDVAEYYENEMTSVTTVCDVFRFAIENGTGVEVNLTLEKKQLHLEQHREESEVSLFGEQEEEYDQLTPEGHSEQEEDEEEEEEEEEF